MSDYENVDPADDANLDWALRAAVERGAASEAASC